MLTLSLFTEPCFHQHIIAVLSNDSIKLGQSFSNLFQNELERSNFVLMSSRFVLYIFSFLFSISSFVRYSSSLSCVMLPKSFTEQSMWFWLMPLVNVADLFSGTSVAFFFIFFIFLFALAFTVVFRNLIFVFEEWF